MGVTQYIGARYVPLFADPAEWTKTRTYEPLTIVMHEGNSFTSKQFVPIGIDINNDDFWAETGNYNAQVEAYRQEVLRFDNRITNNKNDINTLTNNLNTLTNNIESLYVTPEMFGAVGDGETDDIEAFENMFAFVNSHIVAVDSSNYSTIPIKLYPKKYMISRNINISNEIPCNVIEIDGNNGWILGNGFYFENNAGWKVSIKNLNFADSECAFNFEYRNLEYGNFVFDNLRFRRVVKPFIVNRRSCMVEIKNCFLMGVTYIGEFLDVDRLYFHRNWIEPKTLDNMPFESLLLQKSGYEGSMFIYNNLFVPVGGTNSTELAWIEVNEHARIYNNRFGGESSNYHPVCIGEGFKRKGSINSKMPYCSIDHNDGVYGYTSIILRSIDGFISINDNEGWISGNKVLVWSSKIDEQEQADMISNVSSMVNIVIKNNVGRSFTRSGQDASLPSQYNPTIPTNITPLVNRGTRNLLQHSGGSNNGEIIRTGNEVLSGNECKFFIKNIWKSITGTNVANNFRWLQTTFLIRFCYGFGTNYEASTHLGILQFNLESNTTVMKPNFVVFGSDIDVSVKINNEVSINLATVTDENILEIDLISNVSNKHFKSIQVSVLNVDNDLGILI